MKALSLSLVVLTIQPALADCPDNLAGIKAYRSKNYSEAKMLFKRAIEQASTEQERQAFQANLELAEHGENGTLEEMTWTPGVTHELPKPRKVEEEHFMPRHFQSVKFTPQRNYEPVQQQVQHVILTRPVRLRNDPKIEISATVDLKGRIVGEIINHSDVLYDRVITFSGVNKATGQPVTILYSPPHLKPGEHESFTASSYEDPVQSCTVEEW